MSFLRVSSKLFTLLRSVFIFLYFSSSFSLTFAQSCCDEIFDRTSVSWDRSTPLKRQDIKCVKEAESTLSKLDSSSGRMKCLLLLAKHHYDYNRFDSCLVYLDILLLLRLKQERDVIHKISAHNIKADCYEKMGYLSLAEQHYNEAVNLSSKDSPWDEKNELSDHKGLNLTNLILLYANQGRFSLTRTLTLRIENDLKWTDSILTKEGNNINQNRRGELRGAIRNNIAYSKMKIAQQLRTQMRHDSATFFAKEAMTTFKENLEYVIEKKGAQEHLATALANVISGAIFLKQYDAARGYIEQFDTSQQLGIIRIFGPFASHIRTMSANVFAKQGSFDTAGVEIQKAFRLLGLPIGKHYTDILPLPDIATETGMTRFIINTYMTKGEIFFEYYKKNGDLDHLTFALECYKQAIEYYNIVQYQFFSEETVVANRALFQTAFESATIIAANLYQAHNDPGIRDKYWKIAFSYAEQTRSFVLRQSIRFNTELKCGVENVDTVLCKEQRLRKELIRLKYSRESKDKASYIGKLEESEQFIDNLRKTNHPHYYKRYDNSAPSVEDIQSKLLGENTAFIEYVWTNPEPFALWITKRAKGLVRLPVSNGDSLWSKIYDFRTKWLVQEDDLDKQLNHELYKTILEKVLKDIKATGGNEIKKLVISTHGVLNILPFDIFLEKPVSTKLEMLNDWPLVLKKYVISYQPSAAIWLEQAKRTQPLIKHTAKVAIFVNRQGEECSNVKLDSLANFSTRKLPNKFPNKADTLKGENEFWERANRIDIVHMSMHSCLDRGNSERPILDFVGKDVGVDDFYANTGVLKARLMVFGCCETAKGAGDQESGLRGEGVLGLARSVNYAGCPNMIATLNSVYDEEAAKLLEFFYKSLIDEGLPSDEAIREAKLKYIKLPPGIRKHPRFWGNFVCLGLPVQLITPK